MFIPTVPVGAYAPTHHVDILCSLGPMPSAQEWEEKGPPHTLTQAWSVAVGREAGLMAAPVIWVSRVTYAPLRVYDWQEKAKEVYCEFQLKA